MTTRRAAQLRALLAGRADVVLWTAPWLRDAPFPAPGGGVHVVDLHDAIGACPGRGAAAEAAWCAMVAALCRGATLGLVGSAAELGFWSALGVDCPLVVVGYAPGDAGGDARPGVAGDADDPALHAAARRHAGMAALLDLRRDTPAARVATPTAVIDALHAGVPVASTVDGPLSQAIAAAGAGCILVDGMDTPKPKLAPKPAPGSGRAARTLARRLRPDPAALDSGLGRAVARDAAARAAWQGPEPAPQPLGAAGRVLVFSNEGDTLTAPRVHLPFEALRQRGGIAGYTVVRRGERCFAAGPDGPFDAIWVQRGADPGLRLVLAMLGQGFAYDIDDNLLTSPSYRPPFARAAIRTVADMLRRATVVSCATARLAGLLEAGLDTSVMARAIVTPNLADAPALPMDGAPTALIWASSDRPALTRSGPAIAAAVRAHCLEHGTRLVCIGTPPPDCMEGMPVEAHGLLAPAAYRELLRRLAPAVLLCPLETDADDATLAFIAGKSDIKLIEAHAAGLVTVASDAPPYRDSAVGGAILVPNTEAGWRQGLAAAQGARRPASSWPPAHDAGGFGLAPWAEALRRARLPAPVPWSAVDQALREARAFDDAVPPERLDEAHYLDAHADVRAAVEAGTMGSAREHYAWHGRLEGREARRQDTPETRGEAWWTTLLHEIGRLEAAVARRRAAGR